MISMKAEEEIVSIADIAYDLAWPPKTTDYTVILSLCRAKTIVDKKQI